MMGNNGPSYPETIVAPYREELVFAGFDQLLSPQQVDGALNRKDDSLVLVVLNSVCGCSAKAARPGAILSLLNEVIPDARVTLFAGMEKEAVSHFRERYLSGKTPSSPNIALFKNGQLIHILHRYQIERMTAAQIADQLIRWYNENGSKKQSAGTRDMLRKLFAEKYQADPLYSQTESENL